MKPKYSPGPYIARASTNDYQGHEIISCNGKCVAETITDDCLILTVEERANADLLICAPDMADFIHKINAHVIKCARRDTNIEHYPAEWSSLLKQLREIVSRIP